MTILEHIEALEEACGVLVEARIDCAFNPPAHGMVDRAKVYLSKQISDLMNKGKILYEEKSA